MVVDRLSNAPMYHGLGKRMEAALEYLRKTDFSRIAPGRYEIDGANVYALVQEYLTKPKEQGRLEAHRRYVDVQYVVEGVERMGYASLEGLKVSQAYDEAKDCLFLEGDADFFLAPAGTFAIYGPQDAHMPGIAIERPERVKKVVVKVLAA
jgi:YhcH/YjgK/YiaL family protein